MIDKMKYRWRLQILSWICKSNKKKHFIFGSLTCEKRAILSEYHISKFPDLYRFCEKDLEKIFIVFFKKRFIMWEKRHEKSLPPKDKLFSKLKIIKEYLMETANIHKECRVHWTGKK